MRCTTLSLTCDTASPHWASPQRSHPPWCETWGGTSAPRPWWHGWSLQGSELHDVTLTSSQKSPVNCVLTGGRPCLPSFGTKWAQSSADLSGQKMAQCKSGQNVAQPKRIGARAGPELLEKRPKNGSKTKAYIDKALH